MRSREELEYEYLWKASDKERKDLVFEVLLDIRDLLTPKQKTVHPKSAPPPEVKR